MYSFRTSYPLCHAQNVQRCSGHKRSRSQCHHLSRFAVLPFVAMMGEWQMCSPAERSALQHAANMPSGRWRSTTGHRCLFWNCRCWDTAKWKLCYTWPATFQCHLKNSWGRVLDKSSSPSVKSYQNRQETDYSVCSDWKWKSSAIYGYCRNINVSYLFTLFKVTHTVLQLLALASLWVLLSVEFDRNAFQDTVMIRMICNIETLFRNKEKTANR